jgi:hypothetical protein
LKWQKNALAFAGPTSRKIICGMHAKELTTRWEIEAFPIPTGKPRMSWRSRVRMYAGMLFSLTRQPWMMLPKD